MSNHLLYVENLKTCFGQGEHAYRVVDGIDFYIDKGETFALLGESGCGKSMTALSIMQLVPTPAGQITNGRIFYENEDILRLPEVKMRHFRGQKIAMIFQEPMLSLNPVLTIGQQISEVLKFHLALTGAAATSKIIQLLTSVGIADATKRIDEYPHQLSGGMKQRVMIAIALSCDPDLLIADEPTTALDVTIQAQVLDLLKELQQKNGMSIMLITHDLGVVAKMADRVAVMYAGQIVEEAPVKAFFEDPRHPYSQKLFASLPDLSKRSSSLAMIPGFVPALNLQFKGCRFESRCDQSIDECRLAPPKWHDLKDDSRVACHLVMLDAVSSVDAVELSDAHDADEAMHADSQDLLDIINLKIHFPIHKGLFKRVVGHVFAVDDVSFTLRKGRTMALVGESGCGKSTVAKGIVRLINETAGAILYQDKAINKLSRAELSDYRSKVQIIFQDPFSSMNPRMMVHDIIKEGMQAQNKPVSTEQAIKSVKGLLKQVGLSEDASSRYPHEFSGGQRQRISIARALAVNPEILICDEPTSALDVSVQAQILNLLKKLQLEMGLSFLFITHNISVVAYLAHEVAVMYLGRIVEYGTVYDILNHPKHPYTEALLSAVPKANIHDADKAPIKLEGDIPSPISPPTGCYFHPRCPKKTARCETAYPPLKQINEKRFVHCFLYEY